MKIEPFDTKYKRDFIELNRHWIETMFAIEPEDIEVLNNIESYIKNGAQVFFAINEGNNGVMSCCMIEPLEKKGEWEIAKYATKDEYKGQGAGYAVLKAFIDYAKSKQAKKIMIVTNTKCEVAIHLYNKFGFTKVEIDEDKIPFKRGNYLMEQLFE